MIAIEYLKSLPYLPVTLKRGQGKEVYERPSNSELYRWLKNGSIDINGELPQPNDEVRFPVRRLMFFPGGHRQTTYLIDKRIKVSYG